MFNNLEKNMLDAALDQAIASQKRNQNTSKSPILTPIYKQIQTDLEQLKYKISQIKALEK